MDSAKRTTGGHKGLREDRLERGESTDAQGPEWEHAGRGTKWRGSGQGCLARVRDAQSSTEAEVEMPPQRSVSSIYFKGDQEARGSVETLRGAAHSSTSCKPGDPAGSCACSSRCPQRAGLTLGSLVQKTKSPRKLITKVGLTQLQLIHAQNSVGLDLTCSKSVDLNGLNLDLCSGSAGF